MEFISYRSRTMETENSWYDSINGMSFIHMAGYVSMDVIQNFKNMQESLEFERNSNKIATYLY